MKNLIHPRLDSCELLAINNFNAELLCLLFQYWGQYLGTHKYAAPAYTDELITKLSQFVDGFNRLCPATRLA